MSEVENKLANYIERSGKSMCAIGMAYDLSMAAEKMTDPNNVGLENQAWREGPYLSSPANRSEISREFPYIIRTSRESAVIAKIVVGDNPKKESNGGVRIPLPERNEKGSRVEPIISKLAIIEQFEEFKEFMQEVDGPYNAKKAKEWTGKIEEDKLLAVLQLTDRRNELTHEDQTIELPTMKEAVEYFYLCQYLSREVTNAIDRIDTGKNSS